MTAMAQTTQTATRDLGGKYLTFIVADEEYGLEILKVREIIGMMDITKVPRTPHFVKGVINLRGKVIAVVDIRLQVRAASRCRTPSETCIIVVEVNGTEIGLIVDRVSEVPPHRAGRTSRTRRRSATAARHRVPAGHRQDRRAA